MKKILIMDDDVKTTSPLAEDLVTTYGFEVVYLVSAEKVLETLHGSLFDIIILDLMMPVPDSWTSDENRRSQSGLATGEVLYEKIRDEIPDLPILIYTAKQILPIKDKRTILLRKPELHSEIVKTINKLIGHE